MKNFLSLLGVNTEPEIYEKDSGSETERRKNKQYLDLERGKSAIKYGQGALTDVIGYDGDIAEEGQVSRVYAKSTKKRKGKNKYRKNGDNGENEIGQSDGDYDATDEDYSSDEYDAFFTNSSEEDACDDPDDIQTTDFASILSLYSKIVSTYTLAEGVHCIELTDARRIYVAEMHCPIARFISLHRGVASRISKKKLAPPTYVKTKKTAKGIMLASVLQEREEDKKYYAQVQRDFAKRTWFSETVDESSLHPIGGIPFVIGGKPVVITTDPDTREQIRQYQGFSEEDTECDDDYDIEGSLYRSEKEDDVETRAEAEHLNITIEKSPLPKGLAELQKPATYDDGGAGISSVDEKVKYEHLSKEFQSKRRQLEGKTFAYAAKKERFLMQYLNKDALFMVVQEAEILLYEELIRYTTSLHPFMELTQAFCDEAIKTTSYADKTIEGFKAFLLENMQQCHPCRVPVTEDEKRIFKEKMRRDVDVIRTSDRKDYSLFPLAAHGSDETTLLTDKRVVDKLPWEREEEECAKKLHRIRAQSDHVIDLAAEGSEEKWDTVGRRAEATHDGVPLTILAMKALASEYFRHSDECIALFEALRTLHTICCQIETVAPLITSAKLRGEINGVVIEEPLFNSLRNCNAFIRKHESALMMARLEKAKKDFT